MHGQNSSHGQPWTRLVADNLESIAYYLNSMWAKSLRPVYSGIAHVIFTRHDQMLSVASSCEVIITVTHFALGDKMGEKWVVLR
jgi:hypothetical protein